MPHKSPPTADVNNHSDSMCLDFIEVTLLTSRGAAKANNQANNKGRNVHVKDCQYSTFTPSYIYRNRSIR